MQHWKWVTYSECEKNILFREIRWIFTAELEMSFRKNSKFRAFEERADACLEGSGSLWLFSGLSGVTANTWVVTKFSASKLLHFKAEQQEQL